MAELLLRPESPWLLGIALRHLLWPASLGRLAYLLVYRLLLFLPCSDLYDPEHILLSVTHLPILETSLLLAVGSGRLPREF